MYRSHSTSASSVAREYVQDHGSGFGDANAAPGMVNRYRYPLWGVQHKTCCNGPMAYDPIGATMRGVRPAMRMRMSPHGPGPIFPRGGNLTSAQLVDPRVGSAAAEQRRWKGVPAGTPVAGVPPHQPPPPCPGRNNVVMNVVPGLGESATVANRGYLLGASESFADTPLQVPMATQFQPMTPPVYGTPIKQAF